MQFLKQADRKPSCRTLFQECHKNVPMFLKCHSRKKWQRSKTCRPQLGSTTFTGKQQGDDGCLNFASWLPVKQTLLGVISGNTTAVTTMFLAC
jgi:hypothetical protein